MHKFFSKQKNAGQTLIETVVAIFVMVMGITAAVGLANYAFSNSSSIVKQIVGVGLAREGIEAIKNMRDSNWLQQTTIDTDCYDFTSASNVAKCYRNWETQLYNFKPNLSGQYHLKFDATSPNFWILQENDPTAPPGQRDKWGLDNSANLSRFGMYTYGGNPPELGSSGYYRKVIVTEDNTGVYANTGIGPKIKVTVQVWWVDRKCPVSRNWPGLGKCSVELDTYLTNWKDY